jgi:hypothetical protein
VGQLFPHPDVPQLEPGESPSPTQQASRKKEILLKIFLLCIKETSFSSLNNPVTSKLIV